MQIIEDTRQQAEKHKNVHAYCDENGITILRNKMLVGDYTLPTNQTVCVDTKKDMQEVYQDLIQDHERFVNELKLAQSTGIRLVVLIEEPLTSAAEWQNPRAKRWYRIKAAHDRGKMLGVKIPKVPPVSSERLDRMMRTVSEKYGVEWQFCAKEETGKKILKILTNSP